jgi:hypothetical protein
LSRGPRVHIRGLREHAAAINAVRQLLVLVRDDAHRTMRRRWHHPRTRALIFTPVEFLEKIAVLIPKPRINLVVYHGVLALRARHRTVALRAMPSPKSAAPAADDVAPTSPVPAVIVAPRLPHVSASPPPDTFGAADGCGLSPPSSSPPPRSPGRHLAWAELLRRIFEIDVLACACGGRLRFIATIEDPPVVERILRHLGLPTAMPGPAPARSPPRDRALSFDFLS